MSKWITRSIIFLLITITISTTVYAVNNTNLSDYDDASTNYDFIEEMKLDSSRYARVDDLSLIDEQHFIPITDDDEFIESNVMYELYFNEDNVSFKVKNKLTNYVWSTAIENPNAGTFTGLLESGIGIEYIDVQKNMTISENIGITDTVFILETEEIENGILLHINIGGYCSTRRCERLYPDYLEGDYTKEEMVELGLSEINISFDLEVTLNEMGINANVPLESIIENNNEEILLSSLIIFPSLGATHMDDVPGYMVLPEGSGALIRYEDNENKYITPFIERFYGLNFGISENRESVLSYPLSMPIFGAVHGINQNGMLGIIESGDFNARLFAFPNGALNLDYNLIFTKVDYRQTYRQPFTSDGSQGTMRQLQTIDSDITIQYNFLSYEASNYVGVGSSYRDYLQANGVLSQKEQQDDIPIKLEYFMSDSEKTFFGSSVVKATTVSDVKEMYESFLASGITNQRVVLSGWNKGGASGYYPATTNYENKLGSNRDFQNLISQINESNKVILRNDFLISSEENNKISYRQDVATGTNRLKITGECDSCVIQERYLLYPNVTYNIANDYYQDFIDADVEIMFNNLGNTTFSYYKKGYYLREDSFNYYEDIMEMYQNIGHYSYPFSYAYQYTESFFYAPLYNSQLKYYDDLIPLIQVVLHGSMDLFSDDLNFNSLGKEQVLSLIDFGVNPAFILTRESSSTLKDTDSSYLYTTEYSLWKNTIIETYDYINGALKYVDGEYMVSRNVLEPGIVKTTYGNGVILYVNYTSSEYIDDVTIPAMDYYVGGVE